MVGYHHLLSYMHLSHTLAGLIESTIERAMALLTKIRQQSVGQHRQVKKVCMLFQCSFTVSLTIFVSL